MTYKGGRPSNDVLSDQTPWPFRPASIRLHPFTQISQTELGVASDSEQAKSQAKNPDQKAGVMLMVDARVELLDQLGDVTKGVGSFRFELYDVGASAAHQGEDLRLQKWEAPLLTLEQNERLYDSITRTYWFRLPLDEAPPANRPLKLAVQFTDQAQHRLMSEIRLSYKPKK